jgi:hypothetical protein
MPHPHPSYAALAIATHPSTPEFDQPEIIIGFGLLVVSRITQKTFEFELSSGVAEMLTDETQLLTELADALPHPTFILSDRIEARVIAPLERAADRQPPAVAAHLRQRLARFQASIHVDIAPPLRPQGTPFSSGADRAMPEVAIDVIGNSIVNIETAYYDLEQRVIGDWWRFMLP